MQWVLALPTKASLHVISEIWLLLQCAVVLQRADADLRHQLTTSIFFLLGGGGGVVRLTAKPRYLLLLHRGKEKSNTVTALRSCQYGPKSLRNASNTLLNLCHEELRQFWRQKWGQPGTRKVYLIKWPVSVYICVCVYIYIYIYIYIYMYVYMFNRL